MTIVKTEGIYTTDCRLAVIINRDVEFLVMRMIDSVIEALACLSVSARVGGPAPRSAARRGMRL